MLFIRHDAVGVNIMHHMFPDNSFIHFNIVRGQSDGPVIRGLRPSAYLVKWCDETYLLEAWDNSRSLGLYLMTKVGEWGHLG